MPDFFQPDDDLIEIGFPCIKATQPIGDIYVASIPYQDIMRLTFFDVRRVLKEHRDVERYLGIQRPVINSRLKNLAEYVTYIDATFPSAVIIALDQDYVVFDEANKRLCVRNWREGETKPSNALRNIGRVLDGQHRIAALEFFNEGDDPQKKFDIPASIFIGADIADQAQIFATVNLEQTKVNKSLVYDLYELGRSRSPQKTCHNIAVILDQDKDSPFYKRIKRLGMATEGRRFEPITQATVVDGLLQYVSKDPKRDRDMLIRGQRLSRADLDESRRLIFRNFFVDERDVEIAKIVYNYFDAVREKWTDAWQNYEAGAMLNRTNGVRALFRFLRDAYLQCGKIGLVPSTAEFLACFQDIELQSEDFSRVYFPPGTSGEAKLYRVLKGEQELTTVEEDLRLARMAIEQEN